MRPQPSQVPSLLRESDPVVGNGAALQLTTPARGLPLLAISGSGLARPSGVSATTGVGRKWVVRAPCGGTHRGPGHDSRRAAVQVGCRPRCSQRCLPPHPPAALTPPSSWAESPRVVRPGHDPAAEGTVLVGVLGRAIGVGTTPARICARSVLRALATLIPGGAGRRVAAATELESARPRSEFRIRPRGRAGRRPVPSGLRS